MRVEFTAEAERDLEHIGDYIALDRPRRALTFLRELRAKCVSLADKPEAFPLVDRYAAVDVRRRVHGNYLIFYRIDGDRIVVLHLLHGAMDYAPILFPESD